MDRNYSYSNVGMLKTSSTVISNAKLHVSKFEEVNTSYTVGFMDDMLAKIEGTFVVLGLDMVSKPSSERLSLHTNQSEFKKLLSIVLTSAKQGLLRLPGKYEVLEKPLDMARLYKSEADENVMELALNTIGCIDSQAELFAAAGIPNPLLQRLRSTASAFAESFRMQTAQIHRASSVSVDTQAILNDIYTEAIGISRIARSLFGNDREMSKLFSFSKIARNYKGSSTRRKNSGTTTDSFAQEIAEAIAPIIEKKVEEGSDE